VISGFRRDVEETCDLQRYYAAQSGNFIPTFRDNLSGCPETLCKLDWTSKKQFNKDTNTR